MNLYALHYLGDQETKSKLTYMNKRTSQKLWKARLNQISCKDATRGFLALLGALGVAVAAPLRLSVAYWPLQLFSLFVPKDDHFVPRQYRHHSNTHKSHIELLGQRRQGRQGLHGRFSRRRLCGLGTQNKKMASKLQLCNRQMELSRITHLHLGNLWILYRAM